LGVARSGCDGGRVLGALSEDAGIVTVTVTLVGVVVGVMTVGLTVQVAAEGIVVSPCVATRLQLKSTE
jgi:hypothetical protein